MGNNKTGKRVPTTGTVVGPTHVGYNTQTGNQVTTPTGTTTPTVVMVPTTNSTPVRRGNSTVPTPVGLVWVTCINYLFTGTTPNYPNGLPVGTRNHLTKLCLSLGVTYYTVRTQVHLCLKGTGMGKHLPTKLPKGVQVQG